MIIRQLKKNQYESFCNFLRQYGRQDPLDASFTLPLTINGGEFSVRLQPGRHNKIAIWQAIHIHQQETGPQFELLTGGTLLSSLLEILIFQGVHKG